MLAWCSTVLAASSLPATCDETFSVTPVVTATGAIASCTAWSYNASSAAFALADGSDQCLGVDAAGGPALIPCTAAGIVDVAQQWSFSASRISDHSGALLCLQRDADGAGGLRLAICDVDAGARQRFFLSATDGALRAGGASASMPCVVPLTAERAKVGRFRAPLTFEGDSAQGVAVGPLPATLGADLTLLAWIKNDEPSASWGRVLDLGNGASDDNILLCNFGNSGRYGYQIYHHTADADNPSISANLPTPRGKWVKLVVVQRGTVATMFMDDALAANGTVTPGAARVTRTSNWIGRSNWAADAHTPFVGSIAGVAVWDRALTRTELEAIKPPLPLPGSVATTAPLPISGLLDLCAPAPPTPVPTPAPTSPPATAPTLKLDTRLQHEEIRAELFGYDLEFTRHDIWEGLSSEMLANRKLSAAPPQGTTAATAATAVAAAAYVVPRWTAVGAVVAETPGFAGGLTRALRCEVTVIPCGVTQSQIGDGFDAGMSAGSAIAVRAGTSYTLRLVLRAAVPGGAALMTKASLATSAGAELLPAADGAIAVPGNSTWLTFTRTFKATTSDDNATLSLTTAASVSGGTAWIGSTSLMPSATVAAEAPHNHSTSAQSSMPHGVRPDVVQRLRDIGFNGLFRFPGGCFAPFYKWRDAITQSADERAPLPTPSTYCAAVRGGVNAYSDGLSENGFDTDEYIALCRALGVAPAITLALQYGTASEVRDAADWVEYCNGAVTTPMGALRAARGHPEPYDVRYWYIGNEISQQARFPDFPNSTHHDAPPSKEEYAAIVTKVVTAVRAVDGGQTVEFLAVDGGTAWDELWLNAAAKSGAPTGRGGVRASSFHGGYHTSQPILPDQFTADAKVPTTSFLAAVRALRATYDAIPSTAGGNGTALEISLDEWGLGPPWVVARFHTAHALYGASFFGAVVRNAAALRIAFTNYFEPINEGAITVHPFADAAEAADTGTGAVLTALGQVMQLYGAHQRRMRLNFALPADDYDLDYTASVDEAASELLLTVANRGATTAYTVPLEVALGTQFTATACSHGIAAATATTTLLAPTTAVPTPASDFVESAGAPPVAESGGTLSLQLHVPAYAVLSLQLKLPSCAAAS